MPLTFDLIMMGVSQEIWNIIQNIQQGQYCIPIYARSLELIVGHGDLGQAKLVHFNTILVGGNRGCTRLPEVMAFCEILQTT